MRVRCTDPSDIRLTRPLFLRFLPPPQHSYGDKQFIDMMWLKTVSGWLVNRLNYDMLYLDADLIYRKNTDELFKNPEVGA